MGRSLPCVVVCLALLLLSCAFSGVAPAAAQGQDQPTIAPFRTARVQFQTTVWAAGEEVRIGGEGEIDATRNAARLTLQVPGAGSTEVITVGGRVYVRDPQSNRWIVFDDATAAGSAAPMGGNIAAPDLSGVSFTRVGPETVGGAPTTRWRAEVDLADLAGQLNLDPAQAAQLEDADLEATINIWVGEGDNYLRRYTVELRGDIPDPQTGRAMPFEVALSLTFSNFNAPVQITAPADAVPASSLDSRGAGGQGGTGQGLPTMPRSGGGGMADRAADAAPGTAVAPAALTAAGALALLAATGGVVFARRRQVVSR